MKVFIIILNIIVILVVGSILAFTVIPVIFCDAPGSSFQTCTSPIQVTGLVFLVDLILMIVSFILINKRIKTSITLTIISIVIACVPVIYLSVFYFTDTPFSIHKDTSLVPINQNVSVNNSNVLPIKAN